MPGICNVLDRVGVRFGRLKNSEKFMIGMDWRIGTNQGEIMMVWQ